MEIRDTRIHLVNLAGPASLSDLRKGEEEDVRPVGEEKGERWFREVESEGERVSAGARARASFRLKKNGLLVPFCPEEKKHHSHHPAASAVL